ncbi:MAG: hypothetical protein DRG78_02705 [Epsilonproteobacteria bacterium]|nr:MAG: hypothetical protein DRG78_02705 [Campylobacterota bacterium]
MEYNIDKKLINYTFDYIKKQLISEVVENFPTVDSIILYGSYGRGEGGWFLDNKKLYPYNDFDLLLVYDKKYNNSVDINKFKEKLSKKVNVKFIDISFITTSKLKNTKNSIYGYDLKYGSKVIYGNTDILDNIPTLSSSNINLIEGEILFFTRLWPFVGSVIDIKNLEGDESRFFRNQMAKAMLSIVDVILLMNNQYDHSYIKRYEMISLIDSKLISDNLLKRCKWALEEKLMPKATSMSKKDVEELYNEIASFYKKYMLMILNKKYNKNFLNILDFKDYYKKSFKINCKRILYILIKRNKRFEKVYWTNIIQMNILSILTNEKEEKLLIEESVEIFKKIGFIVSPTLRDIKSKVAWIRVNM